MLYESTRNSELTLKSADAIIQGISADGGLFVPKEIPRITDEELRSLTSKTYAERAEIVFKKLLTDFSDEEIKLCTQKAYGGNFDVPEIAKCVKVGDETVLELWHGPTCAFKDMALQILPWLMTTAIKKTGNDKQIIILTATSGDTGKAALEGFADIPGIKIAVFYPQNGVSEMQRLQMMTQEGGNVLVCSVKGNFDDCQTAVKQIFTDRSIADKLAEQNMMFSSANSINIGRLIPQIVYYMSAYVDMVESGDIKYGEKINICVPTGNFGNILAAYYAKEMGLPVNRFICASNRNNILTDFMNTGTYDKNRDFFTTASPSMDILISSNLERLVYHLTGNSSKETVEMYRNFAETGKYSVKNDEFDKLSSEFSGGYCDDEATLKQIKSTFDNFNYLLVTHTAVAYKVYDDYKEATGDKTKALIVSTANPFKFSTAILSAFGETAADDFEAAEKLSKLTGVPIPPSLDGLRSKTPRFKDVKDKDELSAYVLEKL
jgi:threonine synthase